MKKDVGMSKPKKVWWVNKQFHITTYIVKAKYKELYLFRVIWK